MGGCWYLACLLHSWQLGAGLPSGHLRAWLTGRQKPQGRGPASHPTARPCCCPALLGTLPGLPTNSAGSLGHWGPSCHASAVGNVRFDRRCPVPGGTPALLRQDRLSGWRLEGLQRPLAGALYLCPSPLPASLSAPPRPFLLLRPPLSNMSRDESSDVASASRKPLLAAHPAPSPWDVFLDAGHHCFLLHPRPPPPGEVSTRHGCSSWVTWGPIRVAGTRSAL